VVPSPRPKAILELPAIERAVNAGSLVIACGGGGVPVVVREGQLVGIEAVIDKDRVSSLLASQLGAELFLISTSVHHVSLHYGTPQEQALQHISVETARRYLGEGQFPPGSMGPKIEAAIDYLEHGGRVVLITSPERISAALEGRAGTRLTLTAETVAPRATQVA
jgi:carbamate kinase